MSRGKLISIILTSYTLFVFILTEYNLYVSDSFVHGVVDRLAMPFPVCLYWGFVLVLDNVIEDLKINTHIAFLFIMPMSWFFAVWVSKFQFKFSIPFYAVLSITVHAIFGVILALRAINSLFGN